MRASPACAAVLALMLAASSARAADPDPWLGNDKALHFGVSAGIAAGSYAASASLLEARGHALLVASGVTLAIGTGKELLDLAGFGDPSWKDFVADVAGTVAGLALAWSVDLLVRGVSDDHPLLRSPRGTSATSRLAAPLGVAISF